MLDTFWKAIEAQAQQLRTAHPTTTAEVFAIIGTHPNSDTRAGAFWAGSGDGSTPLDYLPDWEMVDSEAWYYYVARHPQTGAVFTYVEGDLYEGDVMTR